MILPLHLRWCDEACGQASAWFFPGASVERWLEGLARAGGADAGVRLFVVPQSVQDRSPAGLLVVPSRGGSWQSVPMGLPCRLVAGRLFVPLQAQLHPQVDDDEIRGLCPLPVSFFHPTLGLSGFDEGSTLRVWDLLETPKESEGAWNLAQPGAPAVPEFTGISLATPPSLDDLYGGAETEIGGEGLDKLPPAPTEPGEGVASQAGRKLRQFFAKGFSNILKAFPSGARRPTWVNEAADWARGQLNRVNEQLEQLRNKELHRLLHMLATDPEAGLRHAIPLSKFSHRGIAPPGSRLGSRTLSFDPSRLGGGPADFWEVPSDMQSQLRTRYREMADRELQLGRFQRAAYIYAELLGDLLSAANALKQGRHFREAALIYEEHLRNPLEAARCLANGGLLAEAIERYVKLERWLEVAELYERLGNAAEAEAAIRRIIAERLRAGDVLEAARLLADRLKKPDEALGHLLAAWPDSRQAASCVGVAFRMFAELGRHDDALKRILEFKRDEIAPDQVFHLLTALQNPALQYPHEPVRRHAADFSRVLIARRLQLPALSAEDAGRLLQRLTQLAPEDRLLARDTNRHLAHRRNLQLRAPQVTPPRKVGGGAGLVVVLQFKLPRQIEWLHLRREWLVFYAVGVTPKRLTLVRGLWDGELQSVSWECPSQLARDGLLLEPTGERGAAIAVATLGGPPLPPVRMPATDTFQDCNAGTPVWFHPEAMPFVFGDETRWSGHVASGRAILSCHDKRGAFQRSIDMTDALLEDAERTGQTRLCMAAIGNGVAIALGDRLVFTHVGNVLSGGMVRIQLPGQVIGLVPTLPHTRFGVVALLDSGAVLCWKGSSTFIELDRDIQSPMAAFVSGGPLVLVSGTQLVLMDVSANGVSKVTRIELSRRPRGIVPTSSAGHFAILDDHGEITVYRVVR